MAVFPSHVSHHTRHRHELHYLQSVSIRLDERQLQERIPAGITQRSYVSFFSCSWLSIETPLSCSWIRYASHCKQSFSFLIKIQTFANSSYVKHGQHSDVQNQSIWLFRSLLRNNFVASAMLLARSLAVTWWQRSSDVRLSRDATSSSQHNYYAGRAVLSEAIILRVCPCVACVSMNVSMCVFIAVQLVKSISGAIPGWPTTFLRILIFP